MMETIQIVFIMLWEFMPVLLTLAAVFVLPIVLLLSWNKENIK